jgi:hypothetical protein
MGWEKRHEKANENNTPALQTHCKQNANEMPTRSQRLEVRKDTPLKVPPIDPSAVVALWNEMAGRHELPLVQKLTNGRRVAVSKRLAEVDGLDGMAIAFCKVAESSFLAGANDRGWRADFDFVMKAKNFTKVLEGGYDNREPKGEENGWVTYLKDVESGRIS